jgi:hypothetical protein
METIIDEIGQATARLGLDPAAMRLLGRPQSETVFLATLNHFVASSDRRWWWEDFREPGKSIRFEDGEGWRRIPKIAPYLNEPIWLIAEDDSSPHYPVFDTTPEVASLVIGECYGFEYYLVAKDMSWLLCETHHNVMCAIGVDVEARLQNAI